MPVTLVAVIVAGYSLYLSVGMAVFGFLTGYAEEEGLKTGARYFLLEFAGRLPGLRHLPAIVFYLFAATVFGAITLWAWNTCCSAHGPQLATSKLPSRPFRISRADFIQGEGNFLPPAFALAAALMFLFSPHYAWYIAWLFPFFCLMPSLPMATYLMAFFYGYTTWLADPGPKMFLLNERIYLAVFCVFIVHLALKTWPVYRLNFLAHRNVKQSAFDPKSFPELSV